MRSSFSELVDIKFTRVSTEPYVLEAKVTRRCRMLCLGVYVYMLRLAGRPHDWVIDPEPAELVASCSGKDCGTLARLTPRMLEEVVAQADEWAGAYFEAEDRVKAVAERQRKAELRAERRLENVREGLWKLVKQAQAGDPHGVYRSLRESEFDVLGFFKQEVDYDRERFEAAFAGGDWAGIVLPKVAYMPEDCLPGLARPYYWEAFQDSSSEQAAELLGTLSGLSRRRFLGRRDSSEKKFEDWADSQGLTSPERNFLLEWWGQCTLP